MLHRNGTPPAPDLTRGKAVPAAARTEFLSDRPADTPRSLAYHFSRQQFAGIPLLRWLYGLLVVIAFVLLLRPGFGWWFAGGVLLVLAVLWSWMGALRHHDFVRFKPGISQPNSGREPPGPLPPADKLPVYVSGFLSVDTKVRRFSALPGFYRTFATREHALLCQARPRRFGALVQKQATFSVMKTFKSPAHLRLVSPNTILATALGTWPEEEQGLWYAFFQARQVRSLQFGEITFDRTRFQGVKLEYAPDRPLDGKSKRRYQRVTLYLAFPQEADFHAALADLMVEPIPAAQAQSSGR